MAVHNGYGGNITFSGSAVGVVRSWSIDQAAEALETTNMGSGGVREYIAGLTSWSGSLDLYFDETDAGQDAVTIGASATLTLDPDNLTTDYSGTAIITGITKSASVDGLVEMSVTFQGSGTLIIAD